MSKYTILHLLILLCFCSITLAETTNATLDSLIKRLKYSDSPKQEIETLVNLTDYTSGSNNKSFYFLLWKEALKYRDYEAATVAMGKILADKLDKKEKGAFFYYLNEARTKIKDDYGAYISNYYEMLYSVREMLEANEPECRRIMNHNIYLLKKGSYRNPYEHMKELYIILCAMRRIGQLKDNLTEMTNKSLPYCQDMLKTALSLPLEKAHVYLQQAYMINANAYLSSEPQYAQFTKLQLKAYERYLKIPSIKKRPFFSQRARIHSYGSLAASEALPQKERTFYFNSCINLLNKYPNQVPNPPMKYNLALVSCYYYITNKDTLQILKQTDSVIKYSPYPFITIQYLKLKSDLLAKHHDYKKAYESNAEASNISDSISKAESDRQYQELQSLYDVNKIRLSRAELKQRNQQIILGFGILLLGVIAVWSIHNFFIRKRLIKLYKELSMERKKAQESEMMKSEFLKLMGHEVRTPMNIITGYCSMIFNDDLDKDTIKTLSGEVMKKSDQLLETLKDMLEVANLDSSNELPLEKVDIKENCTSLIQKYQMNNDNEKVQYDINGSKECVIITNRPYFTHLIDNLLSNASKFTQDGKVLIDYYIDREQQELQVCVSDTGIGIPDDKKEWVFERFTKIDDFRSGTGMGLYVCKLIMKLLKGRIWIEDNGTKGTKVIFRIPLMKENQADK